MIELLSYDFVQLAILCVLVLAGIHAYLGFHVVSRGVIFVDLALAQMAALGAVVAFCVGFEHGALSYFVSLLFTFAGAFLISISRMKDDRVPQEAFIGIVYAGSTALAVLLLSHHPEGAEILAHMISGSLLTVTPGELIKLVALFAVVGAFFVVMRSRFELISTDRPAAVARGWRVVWWDFAFYAAFALVVTSAVRVAGVLLVFSLLVIPPVSALLMTSGVGRRLIAGWIIATVGGLGGILLSVSADFPAGPSVITVLAGTLVLVAIWRRVARKN